jgi:hypothetical protein
MSRKKESGIKNFLDLNGYLLVFTSVSIITLCSYFLASSNQKSDGELQVLGTSSVRGVWFNTGGYSKCNQAKEFDATDCITKSDLDKYLKVNKKEYSLDSEGNLMFSNDELFVNANFEKKRGVDSDVWNDLYIGNIDLKINDRSWVFENVVWGKEFDNSLVSIVNLEKSYLIIFHPSTSLTGLNRQFWVFEYRVEDDVLNTVSFVKDNEDRAFLESTDFSVYEDDDGLFFVFESLDPSYNGYSLLDFYSLNTDLQFEDRFVWGQT